jgi:hypothetical protein
VAGKPAPALQAGAYTGTIQTDLTVAPSGRGPIVVHLYRSARPLSHRHVLISLARLPDRQATTKAMQGSGNGYRAVLPIATKGWWEVSIRLSHQERPATSFLLHVSSARSVVAVYPLFVPVGSTRSSVSLALGREIAGLRVQIGAIGSSTLHIRLPSPSGPPPARLQVRLVMLDMAMPVFIATARREKTRRYAANVFFSMPGVWRVEVSDGQAHGSAALIIGKPGSA